MHWLTTENLQKGITKWHRMKFSGDFHNGVYRHLYAKKQQGFTVELWAELVDILASWRAIRSSKGGISKPYIYLQGLLRDTEIMDAYNRILEQYSHQADISLVEWEDVARLFATAYAIKGAQSPVFASKLCHLLLPSSFIIYDRAFVGNIPYKTYTDFWMFCKDAWNSCAIRDELRQQAEREMYQGLFNNDVSPDYPWSTRIIELCVAGGNSTV